MDFKLINRITGVFVFLFSLVIYVMTVQPTLSFWDCGEFLATALTLGIPHPPGAPLHILVGKIFTMLPTSSDIAVRMNYMSVLAAALCNVLVYSITVKMLLQWKEKNLTTFRLVAICISGAIGALALGFCDAYWFNALEAEVYAFGTFLVGLSTWIMIKWWEKADEHGSDKYLLLLSYIIGLALGIHLLVAQCAFLVGILFFFKRYDYSPKKLIIALGISAVIFFIVYPGIVIKLPTILSSSVIFGVVIVAALVYGAWYGKTKRSPLVTLACMSLFLMILGYSTYAMVLQRASVNNLSINENKPDNLPTLISYLSREQYGQQPLFLPRRYSQEPQHQAEYSTYSSDMDFMWKYQINEMFNRYLFWQFIGRAGYDQGDGVDFKKLWAIPFLLGMLGAFYQFKKDWRLAFFLLMMFIMMGVVTALYQNQQDPQPRERDYFYIGAFMAFAIWIGIGVYGLIDQLSEKMNAQTAKMAGAVVLILSFILVPVNMIRANYHYQSRAGNYFPYDYAYNLLQSLDKDAIIFTNGDNDTFPLWSIQTVYGVRTDVRIVNLSLAQTEWYNVLLKERPFGSLPVPFTYTDAQLKKIQPIQWDEKRPISVDVPVTAYPDSMKAKGNLPTKLVWTVPATIHQGQGANAITAVKGSDLIILDIIKANKWERPIYFSVTITEDNYVGLGDHLIMEGMGQRLVPYKVTASTTSGTAVNQEILRKNLMDTPQTPVTTPKYGFLWRSISNPDIFFDETQKRMAQTYRTLFLRLAYTYMEDSVHTDYAKVATVLDKMESSINKSAIPLDYRVEYDVALLYKKAGKLDKFNEYSSDVLKQANIEMSKNPQNFNTYYNPYRISMDLYEERGEYQQAIDVLNKLMAYSPNDPNLKAKLESIKAKMNGAK